MANIYGYIRVSTKDQNEARQVIAMKEYGISPSHLFLDKQSGKDFNRPQYQKLLKKLKKQDTLVIKSIDRLGRNYDEILEQWRILTKQRNVNMVILDMPLLNTQQSDKDLTGVFISDLVLQILSYVAQTERENIKRRQAEGIAAAKERGVKFGRQKKEIPKEFYPLARMWKDGKITARSAASKIGITHPTFLRWVKKYSA